MSRISPNTSNQNFETAILFNAVESSVNYVFEDDKPPTPLRARVLSYALGAYKVLIDRAIVENSKWSYPMGH